MAYKDLLEKIEDNQRKITEFGKFDDDILKKINYKLRLDWNYYSNRMEGGTLTLAETRSVMVGNIEVKGKPFKDVAEMTGHDKIILEVLKMSKGELDLAEKRIKEIHKGIMFEDDPEKAKQIGQWKQQANEIISYKGEKIGFSAPGDVAEEIHQLIDRTKAELEKIKNHKNSIHPVELASQFHIDFVTIHPFYDGNGRTTRILTNILLMACGYPAIIIKDDRKEAYYKLLGDIQAYGGETDLFHAFIAERVIESQRLILDALEGKDIEELDDIDKEIKLWKQKLSDESLVLKKEPKLVRIAYKNSIRPILDLFIKKTKQFDELFTETIISVRLNDQHSFNKGLDYLDRYFWIEEGDLDNQEISNSYSVLLKASNESISSLQQMHFEIYFKGFKKNGVNMFDERTNIHFSFEEFAYKVSLDRNEQVLHKKLYSEEISTSEIDTIVKNQVKELFEKIKNDVERMNSNL